MTWLQYANKRTHLLTYSDAHIQMKFGVKDTLGHSYMVKICSLLLQVRP